MDEGGKALKITLYARDGELLCPECDGPLSADVEYMYYNAPLAHNPRYGAYFGDSVDADVFDAREMESDIVRIVCGGKCGSVFDVRDVKIDVEELPGEKPEGRFVCELCGRECGGGELYADPSSMAMRWTCSDLACGGPVRKVS